MPCIVGTIERNTDMAGNIFERVEIKYLMDKEQYEALMKKLDPYMQVDDYGLSTISSIYYDTENYDVIRTSMEKPVYKEKLRLRAYGTIKTDSTVYLELKKKYDGVVYKRRVALPIKVAADYLEKGIYPIDYDSQILREIDYFILMNHPHNGTLIACDRVALFGKEDHELRITFDKNIRTSFNKTNLLETKEEKPVIEDNEYLMEIKVLGSMPLWLTEALNELKIYPHSFSKYAQAMAKYMPKGVNPTATLKEEQSHAHKYIGKYSYNFT